MKTSLPDQTAPDTAAKAAFATLPFDDPTGAAADTATALFALLRERMGWTDEYLAAVEDSSYPAMKDLDEMVRALHWTRTTGRKIVVLPDYDMDGISSGVLGYAGLSELGFDVELYVPDYRRGHDIHPDAIDELIARHPGAGVVITCDGGVNSHEGIQRGRDRGLIMLVTDHHVQLPTHPDGSVTPSAHVTVDPERIDETYPHPAICGAFVLYQVLMAYAREHAPHRVDDISLLKLFAGLGTVSDVMPLRYENRQLVRDSLSLARMLRHALPAADLATPYDVEASLLMTLLKTRVDPTLPADDRHSPAFVTAFRGFAYVLQSWRENKTLKTGSDLQPNFYAFYVAPAFNALRRISAPMHLAFDVFTASTPDVQLEAARKIIEYNEIRKEQVVAWMDDIQSRDQPLAPHIWLTDAPTGMLGLLAGRLQQEHGIPVVVVTDPGQPALPHSGSARAPMWFPVISTLTARGFTAVGHEQACGVRAGSLDELGEIAQALAEETSDLQAQIMLDQAGPDAVPEYELALATNSPVPGHTQPDAPLPSPEILLDLAERIEVLAPFGHAFPRPTIRIVVDLSRCLVRVLGEDEAHLKLLLPGGLKLLWWRSAHMLPEIEERMESPIPSETIVEFDVDLSAHESQGALSVQATVIRVLGVEEVS